MFLAGRRHTLLRPDAGKPRARLVSGSETPPRCAQPAATPRRPSAASPGVSRKSPAATPLSPRRRDAHWLAHLYKCAFAGRLFPIQITCG